jgi:hypothetical protein
MILRHLHRPHRHREIAPRRHPVPQLVEVVGLHRRELGDTDGVHARRSAVGLDLLPRLVHETFGNLKRLRLGLRSTHRLLPRRIDLWTTWPAQLLHSNPITGPSPLLRAGPPLCLASVLCRSRCSPVAVLPLDHQHKPGRRYRGDRFSCSMPAPAPSSRHLYTGHHQGNT